MRTDRVIKLPVFRTMVRPIARKAWKCDLCRQPVEEGHRYTHYIDRRIHEIKSYRFHNECFNLVMAYCMEKNRTTFTPVTVRNWANKKFCEPCKTPCSQRYCKRIEASIKTIRRNYRRLKKDVDNLA